MSGAARRRGRGRARDQDDTSGGSERLSIPAGGFDGPASRGSGSGTSGRVASPGSGRGGSSQPAGGFATQGGDAGSRLSSNSGAQSQPPMPRYDPALDPSRIPKATDALKNVDLPASFFNVNKPYNVDVQFKARPGFNSNGKEIKLELNAWEVKKFPTVKIQQYDVVIGDGAEKPIVIRKVWNSKIRRDNTGPEMIFDGNKLAWSLKCMGEMRILVDLDAEEGRPVTQANAGRNTKRLRIAPTKELHLSVLDNYLDGQVGNLNLVGEAINFLDHLLREGPSKNPNLVAFKRSFFARQGDRMDLGAGVEVFRGVYQSMRLVQGHKMVLNIDVANTTFWKPSAFLACVQANQNVRDIPALQAKLRNLDVKKVVQSRFRGTLCVARFKGNKAVNREWKIHKISDKNAKEEMIETREQPGKPISVEQYFRMKYNLSLQYPLLPLVEMTSKKAKYPMELLHVLPNQRYGAKLDEIQTANMIKFAVSPPGTRLSAIQSGKQLLNWGNDQYLKGYGLQMDSDSIKSNARILPPPSIQFGGKVESPGTNGRWDLRGKKFLLGNTTELKAWGIGFMPGRTQVGRPQVERFAQDFIKHYRGYGGRISNQPPHMMPLPEDPGKAVEALFQGTGNKFQTRPQLLIFLLQDKNSHTYLRIKKSTDCRYGVVSQCLQLQQVLKGSPQYYGNFLMKVNAKLGGCTSQVKPAAQSGFKMPFTVPTMFIGADVSHASPGSSQASMAAITVSYDKHAGRYAAGCQTNGVRVEMISESNWNNVLTPLAKNWMSAVGGGHVPSQVYYMRDGVSEGQFSHVMNMEVPQIRRIMTQLGNEPWKGKLTVVIASKRHHVRAFPRQGDSVAGDKKGNPNPGCLIERDVTMPNEFDFFLYSHIALQGTSRPVHYTVLHDDANHHPNHIQNMIYEHCYQYMRSTTSVSLHPAVYYAHLASNRAIAHLDSPASAGPQGGPGFKQNQPSSSDAPSSEAAPLIGMDNTANIRYAMWYI